MDLAGILLPLTMSKADHILSCGVSQQLYDELERVVEENEEVTKSQVLREGLRRELQKYEVKNYE